MKLKTLDSLVVSEKDGKKVVGYDELVACINAHIEELRPDAVAHGRPESSEGKFIWVVDEKRARAAQAKIEVLVYLLGEDKNALEI